MQELETTKLRAVEQHDLEFTRRWRNDSRVYADALGRPFPITEHDEQRWFESLSTGQFPTRVVWAVALTTTDQIVGVMHLTAINWINRTCELGVWIGPDHWHQGHARRATWLALSHAFDTLAMRQVRLHVRSSNLRARALYESLGFVSEAILLGALKTPEGYEDLCVMRIESTELKTPTSA